MMSPKDDSVLSMVQQPILGGGGGSSCFSPVLVDSINLSQVFWVIMHLAGYTSVATTQLSLSHAYFELAANFS